MSAYRDPLHREIEAERRLTAYLSERAHTAEDVETLREKIRRDMAGESR